MSLAIGVGEIEVFVAYGIGLCPAFNISGKLELGMLARDRLACEGFRFITEGDAVIIEAHHYAHLVAFDILQIVGILVGLVVALATFAADHSIVIGMAARASHLFKYKAFAKAALGINTDSGYIQHSLQPLIGMTIEGIG